MIDLPLLLHKELTLGLLVSGASWAATNFVSLRVESLLIMWPPNVLYVPVVLVLNLLIRFSDCWSVLGRQFHPIFWDLSSSPSRHLGSVTEAASRPSTTARRQYSSSELKSIRASQPKSRLPVELLTTLGDLGIRKRC